MLRILIRMTLFFLAFTLNVTVRAEVLQEPKGCHNNSVLPCAYFIQGHHELIQWGDHKLRLSKGTSFIRLSQTEYSLVAGEALIETKSQLKASSVYGQVYIEKGRALLQVNNKRINFFSLSGLVLYQPRGNTEKTFLPVGFNNFMSRVRENGISDSGYPKPAELDELLPLWASVFTKAETKDLENQISDFRGPWRLAAEKAGPWYVETVKRQIAALEAEREKTRRIRAAKLKEENFFKEMFRRRNHL